MKRLTSGLLLVLALGLLWLGAVDLGSRFQRSPSLILAHNMDTQHPVHQALLRFAERVNQGTRGRIRVAVYPNGQLGNEREVIELLQLGAVALTKVSSLSLETFAPGYAVLNLPFLFRDRDHFFASLDGPVGEEILAQGVSRRFRGLAYYDAGARSFYAQKPILRPQDLKGLKMRVMSSPTAIEMMQRLGGSPTPMAFGELYTGLQQRVIDGAENNLVILVQNRHGEVAKHYSLDEHIMAPDVLIVSETLWQRLSPADRDVFRAAARDSALYQRQLWQDLTRKLAVQAEKMGVIFHHPDKAPFIALARPLQDAFGVTHPELRHLVDAIRREQERP